MNANRFRPRTLPLTEDERRRRRREGVLILVIIAVVAVLTIAENRVIHFGADFPVSNTILMFILININLLLLILLIFLVFRNLLKLLYDRKRRVMGAALRTKLVAAFITLTLVPTTVLFFFAINFVSSSIRFWVNVPVEQALDNSLRVGQRFYAHLEANHRFYLERIASRIRAEALLDAQRIDALAAFTRSVQREFNLHAVEIYAANSDRRTMARSPLLASTPLPLVSADNLQKRMLAGGVRSLTTMVAQGELVRTIATLPFGVERSDAEGFAVVTILIPPELSANLEAIARGFEQYQQIKLLKRPIQITYLITLSIVALLVLFCAIWFGFFLAKSITIPLKQLAEGTRRVAEGDLSFTIGAVADDEIGSLVDSFNHMTRDLRTGHEQLALSGNMLREQNATLEAQRRHLEIVLESVSAGVVTLDAGGFVATINTSAEKMLHITGTDVLRKNFRQLLNDAYLELARDIMTRLETAPDKAVELPLRLSIAGRPRSLLLNINALRDDRGRHTGVVIVFDDMTDLEKAQRMVAWREVARRIAHEVKNPLTPIKLSAQRLRRRYQERLNEAVFDECTRMIIDQVDQIRNLVNEFSAFAKFPTANPRPGELPPLIEEAVALYREGHPRITFDIRCDGQVPQLNLDHQQMKQVLINLFDNAVMAMKGDGCLTVELSVDPILKMVRIEVADTGPGISDEDKTRLFEPYFSKKKSGMGLGLTIVNSIISDHGGMIQVQDNLPQGAKFVIELPV